MWRPLSRLADRLRDRLVVPVVQERLSALVHHHGPDQLFYDVANFVVFNQIDGDYLEFGAYSGDALAQVYQRLEYQWESYQAHARVFGHGHDTSFLARKRFFAFDSFEGLPEAEGADTPRHFAREGTYRCSLDRFRANVTAKGVDPARVIPVPGFFSKTLTADLKAAYGLSGACLIFIDCDLYESAKPVFDFITSTVRDGTVLIIDDLFRYEGHPGRGLRRALREWQEAVPQVELVELTRCSANRVAFACHLRR